MKTASECMRDCIIDAGNRGFQISHVVLSSKTIAQIESQTLCVKHDGHKAPPPPSFMGIPMQESKILPDHVYGILVMVDGTMVQVVDEAWWNEYQTNIAVSEKHMTQPTIH